MKRIICVLYVAICLVFATGCMTNEYSILLCGYSDSIPEIQHNLEYTVWSRDRFQDSKVDEHIEIIIQDSTIAAEYQNSEIEFYNYFQTNRYKDTNNKFFELSSEGKLTSYFWGESNNNDGDNVVLTKDKCVEIVYQFMKNIVDTQLYEVKVEFDDARKSYRVTFEKYIGSLKTADTASIVIKENGSLYSYSSTMLGKVPTDISLDFDMEKINEMVTNKLNQIYKEALERYDEVKYENLEYVLTMISETEPALVCSVDVRCINTDGQYSTVSSERIRFFIQ